MSRATKILAGTTVLGFATSIYLFLANSSLRDEVAEKSQMIAHAEEAKPAGEGDAWLDSKSRDGKVSFKGGAAPQLPTGNKESRLDRRVRRTEEIAAMFGREADETEEQWRARVTPLISMGLSGPRNRSDEQRRMAMKKANVSTEQEAQIDAAMNKVYGDLLDYTNKSVKDGVLSPYERNVTGMLDYAGGLGGILNEAQGSIGKILSPQQMKAIYDSGFEWGEYLGVNAPWEQIGAPPARK
jgi:hypothetical protein